MHATNSLRLGASLRLSRPLQDQTLHAAHGRAARVVQRVCEAACERHEALEARQLARWLGAPLNEDALEASHQRAAGRERQPTMRAARSRAHSRAHSRRHRPHSRPLRRYSPHSPHRPHRPYRLHGVHELHGLRSRQARRAAAA